MSWEGWSLTACPVAERAPAGSLSLAVAGEGGNGIGRAENVVVGGRVVVVVMVVVGVVVAIGAVAPPGLVPGGSSVTLSVLLPPATTRASTAMRATSTVP